MKDDNTPDRIVHAAIRSSEKKAMNEDEKWDFFHQIFDPTMPRLGPGEDASTQKALCALFDAGMARDLNILDAGCGNGAQTMHLARSLNGTILAVDNYQPFLDELQRRTASAGFSHRIRTRCQDMAALGQGDGPFDLIWSEGAVFVIGVRQAMALFHSILSPGGFCAITELCWLKPDPPDECRRFFDEAYPVMTDVEGNLAIAADCGFRILGHFTLPESAWRDSYLQPLQQRVNAIRGKCTSDPEKLEFVEFIQREIDIYGKFSDCYGYEFILMQR